MVIFVHMTKVSFGVVAEGLCFFEKPEKTPWSN